MTAILILDATQRSALAATRVLGEAGYSVHTGDCESRTLAGSSKWSSAAFQYPDPSHDPDGALLAIKRYCAQHKIEILIPMTDVSTHLVQSAPVGELPSTPCPPPDIYETASDKGALMRLAQQVGVAIPDTHYVEPGCVLEKLPDGFEYPVILKPTRSRVRHESGYLHTEVTLARDASELADLQERHEWLRNYPWLLQSFVDGEGQGVFCLYDRGRAAAWFAHRRLREKPPAGGVSVLSESAPFLPALRESSQLLLDAMAWHGPAMVEFRVAADGTPFLMEINARFWGSLQLSVSSGVNFPLLAAKLAQGKRLPNPSGYRLGVQNRWLLGDLDHLYLKLKGREYSLSAKLAAALRFLLPWRPGRHFEVLRWGDLGPFRYELQRYLGLAR